MQTSRRVRHADRTEGMLLLLEIVICEWTWRQIPYIQNLEVGGERMDRGQIEKNNARVRVQSETVCRNSENFIVNVW
jgi:hypothetical protein